MRNGTRMRNIIVEDLKLWDRDEKCYTALPIFFTHKNDMVSMCLQVLRVKDAMGRIYQKLQVHYLVI
jgi:hypothetical protein